MPVPAAAFDVCPDVRATAVVSYSLIRPTANDSCSLARTTASDSCSFPYPGVRSERRLQEGADADVDPQPDVRGGTDMGREQPDSRAVAARHHRRNGRHRVGLRQPLQRGVIVRGPRPRDRHERQRQQQLREDARRRYQRDRVAARRARVSRRRARRALRDARPMSLPVRRRAADPIGAARAGHVTRR